MIMKGNSSVSVYFKTLLGGSKEDLRVYQGSVEDTVHFEISNNSCSFYHSFIPFIKVLNKSTVTVFSPRHTRSSNKLRGLSQLYIKTACQTVC